MSFALFIKPSFRPTLAPYLYPFGIQLPTSNSYALHPTPNTSAIDYSHRIPHKMKAEIYSCSFATSSTDTHNRSISHTHSLSLSFRDKKANSQLKNNSVWRRSAAVSSPRKDANAAPTAASAVWIVARQSARSRFRLAHPSRYTLPPHKQYKSTK